MAGLLRTIGVGDCKVIEDPKEPSKFVSVGVCTEKWVEVIRASKQTDTEDFAFKDTESPRVADMVFEPIERPERRSQSQQRLSSLTSPCLRKSSSLSRRSSTNSPSVSRKSSTVSTTQTPTPSAKTRGTMTDPVPKIKMKDAKIEVKCLTKSVSTSAMILPVTKSLQSGIGGGDHLPPGSPISTPDRENPPVNLNLCDKCEKDIHKVAEGIISGPAPTINTNTTNSSTTTPNVAPPSIDMPWLSKIPRPVDDGESKKQLKSSNSVSNIAAMNKSYHSGVQRSHSNLESVYLQRSKSNLVPGNRKQLTAAISGSNTPPPLRRNMGTPPPHPNLQPAGSKRAPSPLTRSSTPNLHASSNSGEKKSLIPKFSPALSRRTPDSTSSGKSSANPTPAPTDATNKSFIPRVVTPPALRKMFPSKRTGEDKQSTPDRDVVRKKTFNKSVTGVSNPDLEKSSP